MIIFECRGGAVRHRYSEKRERTKCGLQPTRQELSNGTFAYEHGFDTEWRCLRCYPRKKNA